MRSDMKKVVVERPRGQSWVPNRKFGARLRYVPDHDYEDEPKGVGISASYRDYGYGQKWFTDVLGPLERYLRSNVGRPWDKVYSEICAGLDKRKATGLHIFQHMEQFVEKNCYIGSDGKPYANPEGWDVRWFYVHPRTRLLCQAPARIGAHRRRRARLLTEDVKVLNLGNGRGYWKHDEIWYRVKLKYIFVDWRKRKESPAIWDIFAKKEVKLGWGGHWIAEEKKQCNHKELEEVRGLLEARQRRIRKM